MLRDDLTRSQQQQWDLLRDLLVSYAARRPVRKVAVVGNAPLEPDDRRAAEINSSDLTFRMNSLRLDEPGEPPCVGKSCHVVLLSRSVRATPWVFRDYRSRVYLVLQAGYTAFWRMRALPEHWPPDLGAIPVPNGVVTARVSDRIHAEREPSTLLPTSGTIALFLAHEMFADADIVATGFSFLTERNQSEWRHHAGGSTEVNSKHHLDREGALLESWIADGSVRFFS